MKAGSGHPAFEVGLCAGAQGESFGDQPGEEVVGRGDVAAHVHVLELGGVLVTDAAAESAQVAPDRVAVQDPAFCGVSVNRLVALEKWITEAVPNLDRSVWNVLLSLVFNLGCSPDPLILVRSEDSRAAVLHTSRCRATSREGTAAGEESRR